MIKNVSDFRYVDPFQRYSRSKSKVVRNCAELNFGRFFALPFFGGGLPKIVPMLSPLANPEVIDLTLTR